MASEEGRLKTEFAPAERSTESEIERQSKLIAGPVTFEYIADYIPSVFLVLNENRQIIFANRTAIETLETKGPGSLLGLRPGDAMGCENSGKNEGGCGTTEFAAPTTSLSVIPVISLLLVITRGPRLSQIRSSWAAALKASSRLSATTKAMKIAIPPK